MSRKQDRAKHFFFFLAFSMPGQHALKGISMHMKLYAILSQWTPSPLHFVLTKSDLPNYSYKERVVRRQIRGFLSAASLLFELCAMFLIPSPMSRQCRGANLGVCVLPCRPPPTPPPWTQGVNFHRDTVLRGSKAGKPGFKLLPVLRCVWIHLHVTFPWIKAPVTEKQLHRPPSPFGTKPTTRTHRNVWPYSHRYVIKLLPVQFFFT